MLAKTASKRYKTFSIPKKTGGNRQVHHPARELKTLQTRIYQDLLLNLPVHRCAFAYKKNVNLLDHANVHKDAKYLLRMDFKSFFESISKNDIEIFIESNAKLLLPKWTKLDTILLSKIVCYHNSLTIGSVTSPQLSNAICYELDDNLQKLSFVNDVKYSRYADDLYFSSLKPNVLQKIQKEVLKIVKQNKLPSNLKVNFSKTHHSSSKNKMMVTGLILTNEAKVSIGRKSKKRVKSMVYKWSELTSKEKKYLTGYLSFCSSVEPSFINNLCRKYGSQLIDDILANN